MPELGERRFRWNPKKGKHDLWVFAYNPAKQVTRWYSEDNFHKYGYKIDTRGYKTNDSNKGRALRENIVDVLETKLSELYNDKLVDKIRLILNNTPDKVLKDWAEENAHLISTYFKYEESFLNEPDMDGRLFILIQKIGKDLGKIDINPYSPEYINETTIKDKGTKYVVDNLQIAEKNRKNYVKLAQLEKVDFNKKE